MTALIFGSTGQDGFYLTEHLASDGVHVVGVARSGGDRELDVGDASAVREIVREVRPDFVFHLAATSSTAHEHLWANHSAISTGTLAVLDAVELEAPQCRVLLAGSGLQFINDGTPLHEESALDHSSPYVIARNHSLFAARYFRNRGLKVYFTYLFNHDSPRRSHHHLNMRIAEAAAHHSVGGVEKLVIGDLGAEKEFGYAGDVVRAFWKLVNQDSVFECVTGTGVAHSVQEWVRLCYEHVGLNWQNFVETDKDYRSPYPRLVSRPDRLFGTGWRPVVTIEDLVPLMMDEAFRRVAKLSKILQH